MYLVLEFCGGGDLGHYLRRYGRVPESTARYLMQQLAEGLKVLRHHSLVHVSTQCGPAQLQHVGEGLRSLCKYGCAG